MYVHVYAGKRRSEAAIDRAFSLFWYVVVVDLFLRVGF